MCMKTVFFIYWAVGLAAMIGIYNLIMVGVEKRYPGSKGENQRRFLSLPVMLVVYLLGGSLWLYGTKGVGQAICEPDSSREFIQAPRQS